MYDAPPEGVILRTLVSQRKSMVINAGCCFQSELISDLRCIHELILKGIIALSVLSRENCDTFPVVERKSEDTLCSFNDCSARQSSSKADHDETLM